MSPVRLEAREGIAVITLDRPPANAFAPALVGDLRQAFRESAHARGVLLASALPTMFSAGWDLPTLIEFGSEEMKTFVDSYCSLIREVFAFGPPVVAALPGHAIAGGLILAMAADERYAARGKSVFGLSEVLLGVPVPRCLVEIFRHAIGPHSTERLAATGENHNAESAAGIGLIDQLVEFDELATRAWERVQTLAERPSTAYSAIKLRARAEALERFDQGRRDDPFLQRWFAAETRERVGALVAKLKKR